MNVTSEQLEALQRGEAVSVLEQDTECILMLRSAYEDLQRLLQESQRLKKQNIEEIDPSFFEFDEV